MRTGVFVGTFDPFTLGHANIVERALPLFDRLVIGVVADNVHKPLMSAAEERVDAIRRLYAGDGRVSVETYDGLAMDFARRQGAQFIVKGVRTVSDFEYEQAQAYFNRRLGGIETILLYADPQLSHLSSSAVRELSHFGVDVTEFLPEEGHEV
jgi:pantetheine-phosphate adenylyltransferase